MHRYTLCYVAIGKNLRPLNKSVMDYLVHNPDGSLHQEELTLANSWVEEQMDRIGQVVENQTLPVVVDLYFSKGDSYGLMVSAIINLHGDIIFVREQGRDLQATLGSLSDKMKLAIVKRSYRNKKNNSMDIREQQLLALKEYLSDLQEMKKNRTQDVFNQLLKRLLNEVARYIRRRIKAAEMTTAIKRGKFKIQELLDELYLRVYERAEDIPESPSDINHWLYQLADELLEELFQEIAFEKTHFKDLEKMVESEYRMLEEAYTVDGEEKIIPLEELDDHEGVYERYAADDLIFGEDENSLLDEITLQLNQKEIHLLIEKELAKLPVFKRTIMDLYLISQMSAEEIAELKGISSREAMAVIREVNQDLIKKLAVQI